MNLTIIMAIAFIVSGAFLNALPPQEQHVVLELQGMSRKYLIHVPHSYKGEEIPLVLFLHGAGGNSEGAAKKYGWTRKADEESFIVVFPEATPLDLTKPSHFRTNPNVWNSGLPHVKKSVDDIAYLRKVIEDVSKRYKVDPRRVYMTGFSSGASMTFRAGIELSDILTAIAPVSGHLMVEHPKPKRTMSMMLIVGDADPLNPIDGGPAKNPWTPHLVNKPPMIASVLDWLKLLNIAPTQKTVEKKGGVTFTRYGPNGKGQEVEYIVVAGQGHEWPGGERALPEKLTGKEMNTLNATDTIWQFFKRTVSALAKEGLHF